MLEIFQHFRVNRNSYQRIVSLIGLPDSEQEMQNSFSIQQTKAIIKIQREATIKILVEKMLMSILFQAPYKSLLLRFRYISYITFQNTILVLPLWTSPADMAVRKLYMKTIRNVIIIFISILLFGQTKAQFVKH